LELAKVEQGVTEGNHHTTDDDGTCREQLLTLNSLSSSRFLKTILARHKNGPLVIKIFIKPDASMTLRVIQRRLKSESRGRSCMWSRRL